MKIEDFLTEFVKNHEIQHIKTVNGVVIAPVNDEYYLVNRDKIGVEKE